jgi:hypothetical protein
MERRTGEAIDIRRVGQAAAEELARLWGRSLAVEGAVGAVQRV